MGERQQFSNARNTDPLSMWKEAAAMKGDDGFLAGIEDFPEISETGSTGALGGGITSVGGPVPSRPIPQTDNQYGEVIPGRQQSFRDMKPRLRTDNTESDAVVNGEEDGALAKTLSAGLVIGGVHVPAGPGSYDPSGVGDLVSESDLAKEGVDMGLGVDIPKSKGLKFNAEENIASTDHVKGDLFHDVEHFNEQMKNIIQPTKSAPIHAEGSVSLTSSQLKDVISAAVKEALGIVSSKGETHHEWSARVKPTRPCTASDMTFGGKCLNCGYEPSKVEKEAAKPLLIGPNAPSAKGPKFDPKEQIAGIDKEKGQVFFDIESYNKIVDGLTTGKGEVHLSKKMAGRMAEVEALISEMESSGATMNDIISKLVELYGLTPQSAKTLLSFKSVAHILKTLASRMGDFSTRLEELEAEGKAVLEMVPVLSKEFNLPPQSILTVLEELYGPKLKQADITFKMKTPTQVTPTLALPSGAEVKPVGTSPDTDPNMVIDFQGQKYRVPKTSLETPAPIAGIAVSAKTASGPMEDAGQQTVDDAATNLESSNPDDATLTHKPATHSKEEPQVKEMLGYPKSQIPNKGKVAYHPHEDPKDIVMDIAEDLAMKMFGKEYYMLSNEQHAVVWPKAEQEYNDRKAGEVDFAIDQAREGSLSKELSIPEVVDLIHSDPEFMKEWELLETNPGRRFPTLLDFFRKNKIKFEQSEAKEIFNSIQSESPVVVAASIKTADIDYQKGVVTEVLNVPGYVPGAVVTIDKIHDAFVSSTDASKFNKGMSVEYRVTPDGEAEIKGIQVLAQKKVAQEPERSVNTPSGTPHHDDMLAKLEGFTTTQTSSTVDPAQYEEILTKAGYPQWEVNKFLAWVVQMEAPGPDPETEFTGEPTEEVTPASAEVEEVLEEVKPEAPSTPAEVPTMGPRDLSKARDRILDQLSKEKDPAKAQQLKNRLKSLSILKRLMVISAKNITHGDKLYRAVYADLYKAVFGKDIESDFAKEIPTEEDPKIIKKNPQNDFVAAPSLSQREDSFIPSNEKGHDYKKEYDSKGASSNDPYLLSRVSSQLSVPLTMESLQAVVNQTLGDLRVDAESGPHPGNVEDLRVQPRLRALPGADPEDVTWKSKTDDPGEPSTMSQPPSDMTHNTDSFTPGYASNKRQLDFSEQGISEHKEGSMAAKEREFFDQYSLRKWVENNIFHYPRGRSGEPYFGITYKGKRFEGATPRAVADQIALWFNIPRSRPRKEPPVAPVPGTLTEVPVSIPTVIPEEGQPPKTAASQEWDPAAIPVALVTEYKGDPMLIMTNNGDSVKATIDQVTVAGNRVTHVIIKVDPQDAMKFRLPESSTITVSDKVNTLKDLGIIAFVKKS